MGERVWSSLSLVLIKDNTKMSDWGITLGFHPLVLVLGSGRIHLGHAT